MDAFAGGGLGSIGGALSLIPGLKFAGMYSYTCSSNEDMTKTTSTWKVGIASVCVANEWAYSNSGAIAALPFATSLIAPGYTLHPSAGGASTNGKGHVTFSTESIYLSYSISIVALLFTY